MNAVAAIAILGAAAITAFPLRKRLSLVAILYYLGRYIIVHDAPPGFTTLLLSVLFLGGIQLLCLAIIGDYLGRVFDEVKRRPLYLVKSILNEPGRKK